MRQDFQSGSTHFQSPVFVQAGPWMRYTFDKPSRSSSTDSVSVRWAYKYRTRNPQIESSLTLQSQISNHSTSMAGRPAHDVFQALAQSSQNRFPSKPTTCLWIFTKLRTPISVGCASSMNVVLLSHCVCSLKQHAKATLFAVESSVDLGVDLAIDRDSWLVSSTIEQVVSTPKRSTHDGRSSRPFLQTTAFHAIFPSIESKDCY